MQSEQEIAKKAELLEKLWWEMVQGPLLPPCRAKEGIVAGEGSAGARLAIIGEAPGQQEERYGRPFVGRAGHLLRQTLEEVGISPDDVWISNVVKCRPTVSEGGRVANRAPTRAEASRWVPWLTKELDILRPSVILCLGNLAANTLIHKSFKMTEERGKWYPGPFDSVAMATYHPSYVLRQIGPLAEKVRREFDQDFAEVKKRLEEVASSFPWKDPQ